MQTHDLKPRLLLIPHCDYTAWRVMVAFQNGQSNLHMLNCGLTQAAEDDWSKGLATHHRDLTEQNAHIIHQSENNTWHLAVTTGSYRTPYESPGTGYPSVMEKLGLTNLDGLSFFDFDITVDEFIMLNMLNFNISIDKWVAPATRLKQANNSDGHETFFGSFNGASDSIQVSSSNSLVYGRRPTVRF